MGFTRAACAALADHRFLTRILAAAVLFCLAAFLITCGGSSSSSHPAPNHIAYVTLPTRGNVLLLQINGSTGAITKGAETPQVAGTSPGGLALLPSKKFLYVANAQANTISIFSVAGDGTLSLSGTPTSERGSGPHSAVIDPSGKYLLVTNSFSNDVSVFSIDSASGALQEIAGSPFFANFNPSEILVLPSGNFVYVTNPSIGMVTAFTFDSSTGALSTVPGSPFLSSSGASALAVDASGSHLYVANTSAVNLGSTTVGNISAFNISPTSGVLSTVLGSPFTSALGSGPGALAVTPDGHFLYATTAGSSSSIWCFTIDSTNGQLTAVTNSPFSQTAGNLFALIDTSGNFLYIGNASGIAGYTFDSNTGAPTAIPGSPFSTPVPPGKIVISH